jgi:hypothetical protein
MVARRYWGVISAVLLLAACVGQNSNAKNLAAEAAKAGASNATTKATSRPEGPSAGSTAVAGGVKWATYKDPLEKAFTVEVPRGWTVRGGMLRAGTSDLRGMIDITSPDTRINVRVGDAAVALYYLPGQSRTAGQNIDLQPIADLKVEPYLTGQEFAKVYGYARFARICQKLTPEQGPQPERDEVGSLPLTRLTPGEISEGEMAFRCETAGESRVAYSRARTVISNYEFWAVPVVASYVAPADQADLARAVLDHVVDSLQWQDAWLDWQKRMANEGVLYVQAREKRRGGPPCFPAPGPSLEDKMRALQAQIEAFEQGKLQPRKENEALRAALAGVTPALDPMGGELQVAMGAGRAYCRCEENSIVNGNFVPGHPWEQLKASPEKR